MEFIARPRLSPQALGAHHCEVCHEAIKPKNVRVLSCGHKCHKGVSVLGGGPHVPRADWKHFEDTGAFPQAPTVSSERFPSSPLWVSLSPFPSAGALGGDSPLGPGLRAGHCPLPHLVRGPAS